MIAHTLKARLIALSLTLAIGGCSESTGPLGGAITLTPSAQSYTAGTVVNATLSNESFVGVDFGDCSGRLERLTEGRWVRADVVRPCLDVGYLLFPGKDVPIQYYLPSSLESGTYRIGYEVQQQSNQRVFDVRSRTFIVTAIS